MENNSGSKSKKNKKGMADKSSWIIGGTTMIGIGVGFVLLPISSLLLVASVMIGIGTGLVIAAFLSRRS